MQVLHRDDLKLGGFAGLREHRLVMDPQVFGPRVEPGTVAGLGGMVYLADARFNPKGETTMHPHREIDVISVMVDGRISHEGSLENGQELVAGDVQVQRAGGEGFSHNEINPDDTKNRLIQIWALPEKAGEPAGYRMYRPQKGERVRIYGGSANQDQTYASETVIEVAHLEPGQALKVPGDYLVYLTTGEVTAGDTVLGDGDLVRGRDLDLTATTSARMIVISKPLAQ